MRRAKVERKLAVVIAGLISFALIGSQIAMPQAWASRSGSGGGDHPEIDGGKIAMNVGISIGACVVGGVLSSAFSGAGDMIKGTGDLASTGSAIGTSVTNALSVPGLMSGYGAYVAGTQAARAVTAAGSYYGWSNSTIFLASSIASGVTGGIINPGAALGSSASKTAMNSLATFGKGALVGAAGGAASGATILAIDGDKIDKGENAGWGAQLAGMGAGMTATAMSRALLNPSTYTQSSVKNTKIEGVWKDGNGKSPFDGNAISGDPNIKDQTLIDQTVARVGEQLAPLSDADVYRKNEISYGMEAAQLSGNTVELEALQNEGMALQNRANNAGLVNPGQELGIEQVARLINNPNTQYVGTNGDQTNFMIDNSGKMISVDSRVANFIAEGGIRAAPDGSLWVASSRPNFGQVMGNIFVNPVVDTLNQWPVFAGSALSTIATEKMHDDEWKDFAKGVANSFFTSTFDSLATTKNLKPSLLFNIDQGLGNYPTLKYARQQMMIEAVADEMARNVDKLSPQKIDEAMRLLKAGNLSSISEADRLSMVNSLLGDKDIKLSDPAKLAIFGDMFARNKLAQQANDNFNFKQSFYSGLMGALKSNSSLLDGSAGILNNSGVSTWKVFGRQLYNNFRYDLPVSGLSGLITVGLKQTIDANDTMAGSLITLSEVAGTSLARGAVWFVEGQLLRSKTIASITGVNGFNPRVASHRNLQDPVDILISRAQGYIPRADYTTYAVPQMEGLIDNEMNDRLVSLGDADLYQDYLTMSSGGDISEESQAMLGSLRSEVSKDIRIPSSSVIPSVSGGYYKAADTTINIGSDRYYSWTDKNNLVHRIDPGTVEILTDPAYALNNAGQLVMADKYYILGEDGEKIGVNPRDVAKVPGLFTTMAGSLGQGLYEYGLNTLSMGAPIARDNRVSTYTWYRYAYDITNPSSLRTLSLLGSRPGNFADTMSNYFIETGRELTGRNVMTTVADVPVVGKFLGLSPFVPISGYKGMPFTVAAIMDAKFGGADTRLYGQWPSNVFSNVPSNQMHAAFRRGIISYTTGRDILPENKIEDPRIKDPMPIINNVQTGNNVP